MTQASSFVPPPRPTFSPFATAASTAVLWATAVPVVKLLEATGHWPRMYARMAARMTGDFGDYAPGAGDVVVCSFFKAGTTWLLQIALQLAHHGEAEFDNLHYAVPWPDAPTGVARLIIPLSDPSPLALSPTGLRVIKTHLPHEDVPQAGEARYIALVRDPKDVIVSGYHFVRSLALGPMMPSVPHWAELFMTEDSPSWSWATHLAGYWRRREDPNLLFLTYEEMRADPPKAIARIAAFMGLSPSPETLEKVAERSSFQGMKREESKFSPGQIVPWSSPAGTLIRRGGQGGSGELLSPALKRKLDDHFRAELTRLNCDFPYDEVFSVS